MKSYTIELTKEAFQELNHALDPIIRFATLDIPKAHILFYSPEGSKILITYKDQRKG